MIDIDLAPPVATVTLNRPEALNAFTPTMLDALADALRRCGDDPDVSAIVVRGAGRAFSAGVDLSALRDLSLTGGAVGDVFDVPAHRVINAIAEVPAIVIAAVHGYCFTGALELALACDLLIVADNAVFVDTHAKFGLRPSWGMSQRLPRAVGPARAALLSYTARRFTGSEAAAWGLAAEVAPANELDEATRELAADVAANSADALVALKALYAAAARLGLDDGLRFEAAARFDISDTQERIAGFE